MKTSYRGMKVDESGWTAFLGHVNASLDAFRVPPGERDEVITVVQSTKTDIVEV